MTTLAWIFMIVSVSAVTTLMAWCFRQVLRAPPDDHVVPPPDSLGG
ncbi:MAG: hypothetical protein JNK02_05150 [Planctomycetes bacterium]|nr:hypothetical protein [Planctomycetota bacterium]